MTETQLNSLLGEVKSDLQLPSSYPSDNLVAKIKEGEYFLNSLVEGVPDINFEIQLKARSLLKDYVRYSFYGAIDEFKKRFAGELFDTQIDRIQPIT